MSTPERQQDPGEHGYGGEQDPATQPDDADARTILRKTRTTTSARMTKSKSKRSALSVHFPCDREIA